MRITKHGRYGLPNKEAADLVQMGRKGMMDAKRACIDKSQQEVCTIFECLREEMVDIWSWWYVFKALFSRLQLREFSMRRSKNFYLEQYCSTVRKQQYLDGIATSHSDTRVAEFWMLKKDDETVKHSYRPSQGQKQTLNTSKRKKKNNENLKIPIYIVNIYKMMLLVAPCVSVFQVFWGMMLGWIIKKCDFMFPKDKQKTFWSYLIRRKCVGVEKQNLW